METEPRYSVLKDSYPFKAQFSGRCAINREHEYRRNSIVFKVVRADNPMIQLQGVGCSKCLGEIKLRGAGS